MLNHYPKGEAGELEQAGNVNLWVRPSHQRRGFASRLLREANNRRKSRETSPRRGADVEKLARISGSTPVQVRATLDVAQADFMQGGDMDSADQAYVRRVNEMKATTDGR
jgi:hypothetical protein